MYALLLTIFILVAALQILVILMQASKGGGLAGSFGVGGMGAVFGSRGTATFLSKLTAGLAAAFMILSLILGLMKSNEGATSGSLIERERQSRSSSPAAVGVPVVPGSESAPALPPPATQQAQPDSK